MPETPLIVGRKGSHTTTPHPVRHTNCRNGKWERMFNFQNVRRDEEWHPHYEDSDLIWILCTHSQSSTWWPTSIPDQSWANATTKHYQLQCSQLWEPCGPCTMHTSIISVESMHHLTREWRTSWRQRGHQKVGSDALAISGNISRLGKQLRMFIFRGCVNYAPIILVFMVGQRVGSTCPCNCPFCRQWACS